MTKMLREIFEIVGNIYYIHTNLSNINIYYMYMCLYTCALADSWCTMTILSPVADQINGIVMSVNGVSIGDTADNNCIFSSARWRVYFPFKWNNWIKNSIKTFWTLWLFLQFFPLYGWQQQTFDCAEFTMCTSDMIKRTHFTYICLTTCAIAFKHLYYVKVWFDAK